MGALRFKTFEVKEFDAESGTIKGYGSVFGNTDSYGDVVTPQAFNKTLTEKGIEKVKMLWQHNSQKPIGIWTKATVDEYGLLLEGTIAVSTTLGKDAAELAKIGAIDGLSIGYIPKKERFDRDAGLNYLEEVDLKEVSIVTFPANELATLSQVKSEDDKLEYIKGVESVLREAGYSRKDTQAILHGDLYKQPEPESVEASANEDLFKEFDNLINKIKN